MTTPADEAIEVLNRALREDPEATRKIFEARFPCNQALADDETIQVWSDMEGGQSGAFVRVLGLINGLFGVVDDGCGHIAAVHDVVCPAHGRERGKSGDTCGINGCAVVLRTGPLLRFVRYRETPEATT